MSRASAVLAASLGLASAALAGPPPAAPEAPAKAVSAPDLAAATEAFGAALAAKERRDFALYRSGMELLPDSSRLLYRLAAARLLAGDAPGAVEAFRRQVEAGIARDPRRDPELAALLPDPVFQAALAALDALAAPISRSSEGFQLAERDLTEGIAHDPKSGAFFLSSVHGRRILRRSPDGRVSDFVPAGSHGLLAALGMAADPVRRRLWVVSAGLPHARGIQPAEKNRSALLAFDLDTGAWKQTIDAGPGDHGFNDVELAADGSLFVSDPVAHAILRVQPDGSVTTLVAGADRLGSPGGLALSPDGRRLYVADWTNGLAFVDLAPQGRETLTWMRPPAGSTVLGIDGLRRHGNRLVAIQNGVAPPRISSFELSSDGRSLVAARTHERNLPEWDEPTLGVVVEGALWYVANSHWPRFAEDGSPPADLATLTPPSVRRLPLD
jgi:hypothetical protein